MVTHTVPALMRAAASRWRDKTALLPMDAPGTSFAELDASADDFAKALIADGMMPGGRVGIWAQNMWEWVAAAVGAQRAGGILVPINPRLRAPEVSDIVRRARVGWLVTPARSHGADYPEMLRGEDMPELRRVVVLRDPGGRERSGVEVTWDSFLQLGVGLADAVLREREAGVTGDTVSDILFTSGTTGRPKAAVFTHGRTVLSGSGMHNFAGIDEADTYCPLGSFAHHAGYKGGWVNGLVTGATICWTEAHDSETLLRAISEMRVTVISAPPILWQEMLDHPNRQDWDTSSLRFAATGSTMIPADLIRRLSRELGIRQVATGYGLTESGGMTNFTRPEDSVEQVALTAGRPSPDSQVCIAGPDGERVGNGQPGEILVRTKRAMIEYMDEPEATRATIDEDGWLHTGDVGQIDACGNLMITGRIKDMFITNGFNVYPAEVERVVEAIPGVAMCAVIGVPDTRKGEVGHAFIVRLPGASVSADEVTAWCKRNIASYKIPVGVTFVDDLPRNSLGKVLKRELGSLI